MAKVLVCDDDQSILEVIKIMLEESGFEVVTINSGKGIQKKITEIKPNLILLDIWMPGMDGKEIITLLRRDKKLRDIPIVVISALNDTENIAKKSGADGFLSKPFSMEDLVGVVYKYTH